MHLLLLETVPNLSGYGIYFLKFISGLPRTKAGLQPAEPNHTDFPAPGSNHPPQFANFRLLRDSINSGIIPDMPKITDIVDDMKRNPKGIRFQDLCKICDHYFGEARQTGSSHRVYKTPWQGDPRVNIQNDKGKAKAYQVKQVLKAIERLEAEGHVEK